MAIRGLTRALARPDHPLHHLLSDFHGYPSGEIYSRRLNPFNTSSIARLDPPSFDTYTPVTLSGTTRFHGESLGQTQSAVLSRANHTDSLLGPPFISESVQSGNSGVATKMTRTSGVPLPDMGQIHISAGGVHPLSTWCPWAELSLCAVASVCGLVGSDLSMTR